MADQNDTYRILGDLLRDRIGEPLSLKLQFLQDITKNFSPENLIGYGGYGEVYKGMLEDGFVAVKKLHPYHEIEDEPFRREVECLMSIDHDNIVCFVGYCVETQEVIRQHGGKHIFAEIRQRLLCFEYLRNGSLDKHLTAAEPCGLPWRVCYQIIKGICLGLHYLHERDIIHLDLKPDNILLDDSMVPKIADFGLSRLLSEEKSRIITKNICGTWGYIAPEYLENGEITTKSDIYSLGVIIRDVVKGRNTGSTTDQDVLRCWVNRIGQTELEIGYQKQIEECFKISQRCMQRKPEDRPSMQDILHTLEKVEAEVVKSVVGPTPNVGRHEVTKFGPWGGDGGKPRDIKMAPYRLDSLTIGSGTIVDSIEFSYIDYDGKFHNVGPWGGREGKDKIQLGPSEFLIGVSGTIGPFKSLMNVITSLTFVTNSRSYGPYGRGRGTPFHIQMQINGWIVGFFGRSGPYLDAIGVYTNQESGVARIGPSAGDGRVLHDITDHNGEHHSAGPSGEYHKVEFAKFGPWGGDGGKPRDIKMLPYRLDTITISSGTVIDSIEFSYTDKDGQCHATGPWGGHGGDNNSFQLGPSEFLTGVSGSIGSFRSQQIITSLTFVTNARSYGPFGKGTGTSFHIPMKSNGCIVGFFGRSGRYLDAIGVYTNHESERVGQKEAGLARIGPWGGATKVLHDIIENPHHLERVTIFSGTIINSLEYLYTDHNGQQHTAGPWGGCGGTGRKIHFDPQEFIVEVSGTFHPCRWDTSIPNVVSSLTLITNTGKSHGPFGIELGTAFHVPVQRNSRIVGFFAHGENYIEAIGAYVLTL